MGEQTRLAGAGRLCVPVPIDWPTLGWGRLTRSHVRVLTATAVPAVLFPDPPADVVVVELRAMAPRRARNHAVPVNDWRRRMVAGHEAWLLEQQLHHERWSIRLDSDPLHAALAVEGPRDVCEQLVDDARPVPEGWTVVPNVWIDHHGQGYGSVARDDDHLRTLLRLNGLDARLTGVPLGGESRVVGCDPYPTTVVPVGTEVVVTVEPDEG